MSARPRNLPAIAPTCPYCGKKAVFHLHSDHIYGGRDFGSVWQCPSRACDAYVGAHRDTLKPLGRLANKELRALKIQTHTAFDPLWRDLAEAYPDANGVYPKRLQMVARARAYHWLAFHMGITEQECHIAAFDQAQCRLAIELIEKEKPTAASIRTWVKGRQG